MFGLYGEVSTNSDVGNAADVIYLDFAKIFDVVLHNSLILATKLQIQGLMDNVCIRLKIWLRDKKQRIFCKWYTLKMG